MKKTKTIETQRPRQFGHMIKRLRESKGISGRELARRAKIAQASIGHYETGRQVPRPRAAARLARALGIPEELVVWFAYTRSLLNKRDRSLLRQVDEIMLRQLDLYERDLVECKKA